MFGGSNNSTINQLTFIENIVTVYQTNEHGTFNMNYTYKVEGNKLVFEPILTNDRVPPNRQSFNGSFPSNNTWPPTNGSRLPNDTIPPTTWSPNNSRPFNDSQDPFDVLPSISFSFSYSFNEEFNILYLDLSQFIKIQ